MTSRCDPEPAARYVAGTLAGDELTAFELHLLECEGCQQRVLGAAELRRALTTRHRRVRSVMGFGTVGVAAAAVMAWLMLAPSAVQRLGRVSAPPTLSAMQVRAAEDSASVFAERGVAAYQQADYEAAANWLARAHALVPQAGTAFFLGAARLMLRQPDSAAAAFRRVIQSGDPAYRAEAHYYSAKAWLQLNQADSARAHLGAAATLGETSLRAQARALRDSLERIR